MNKRLILFLCSLTFAVTSQAQSLQKPRSIDGALAGMMVQRDLLRKDSAALSDKIKEADRLRNRQLTGVAPETMDSINRAQDSLCLDLRSRLTARKESLTEVDQKIRLEKAKHNSIAVTISACQTPAKPRPAAKPVAKPVAKQAAKPRPAAKPKK